ncbi:MAG: hypothetical protein ACRDY0_09025 [Acidimicrobiales bacterium]
MTWHAIPRRRRRGFLGRFARIAVAASALASFGLGPVGHVSAAPQSRHGADAAVRSSSFGHTAVAAAPTPDGRGFWVAFSDGSVMARGSAAWHGDMAGQVLNAPLVGISATADGGGYWLLGADGGVFTFGDARFMGSAGAGHLNAPALQMQSTVDSAGYFFVAGDGGIFTFGDARFYGSTGGQHLNAPVVGMTATPDGRGYWLVASDGGIFTFGDAAFAGSTGGGHLNAAVVAMSRTADGRGYWLMAGDGGIFTFGDAAFHGSAVGQAGGAAAVGLVATGDGGGYWVVLSDGVVLNFGDAPAMSDQPGTTNASGPPPPSSSYTYEVTAASGAPSRWNPCEAIHYSVVYTGAPAGWQSDVASVMAQAAAASGLSFVADGVYPSATQVPATTRLTISWVPSLDGGDIIGLTDYWYLDDPRWNPQYTSATVEILDGLAAGFSGTQSEGPIMLHELGHALGLGHTPGQAEVMNPVDQALPRYQLGDLNGLWHLGAPAGCTGFYS